MSSLAFVLRSILTAVLMHSVSMTAMAQARVEKNVVYGMFSGSALFMDVRYPWLRCRTAHDIRPKRS